MSIYSTLKVFIGYALRLFFRKIYIYRREVIPKDTPVILAVNHPTAFLDPVLVCTHIRPDIHFILRGDVFTSPLVRWFLRSIHTIPIFRFRDGYSNLKNNQATFDYCYELLNNREVILILAEGSTKFEKRLRPIQKGTARMAFGAYENGGCEDLQIIPVGVNYRDSYHPRSEVMIEFGQPILLKDYLDEYRENTRKAIRELTQAIQKQMEDLVVHVERDEDGRLVDYLQEINYNRRPFKIWPPLVESNELLREEYRIAQGVNHLSSQQKEKLQKQAHQYFERLEEERLSDQALVQRSHYHWINSLALLLGGLPFVLAYLINLPPVLLAQYVAKTKVKRKEFYSSIYFGVITFGYLFYWLILLIIALVIGQWVLIGLVLAMPFLAYFALHYLELLDRWSKSRRVQQLPHQVLEELQAQRGALKL